MNEYSFLEIYVYYKSFQLQYYLELYAIIIYLSNILLIQFMYNYLRYTHTLLQKMVLMNIYIY